MLLKMLKPVSRLLRPVVNFSLQEAAETCTLRVPSLSLGPRALTGHLNFSTAKCGPSKALGPALTGHLCFSTAKCGPSLSLGHRVLTGHLGMSGQIIGRHYSVLVQNTGCNVSPLLGSVSSNLQQVRTYKVRVVLKRRCKGCYFEKREGRWFVECTLKPRHKQMQKMHKKDLYKDDYSKGNIRLAAHWGWRKKRFYWEGDQTPRDLYKPLIDYTNTRVQSPHG